MSTTVVENEQGIAVAVWRGNLDGTETLRTYIHEDTVADVLGYMAVDMDTLGCKDGFCANRNPARLAWWKACNSLSLKTRRGLQALMRDAGVALPGAPYEEADDYAVPAAQHG